jgi:hypothetical protein
VRRGVVLITLIFILVAAWGAVSLPQHRDFSPVADPYLWLEGSVVEQYPNVTMVDGIPQVTYEERQGPEENAVTVAQWGLAHYSSGDTTLALRAADWLVEHQEADGAWRYQFDFYVESAGETLRGPWISGLAQGQAMSLLVRAARVTGEAIYLRAARAAMKPLTVPVADGGVGRTWRGHPFFEEYPTNRPSLVLNGFLFTVIGLHDLAGTGDATAGRLWRHSERTAAAIITQYSIGKHDSAYGLGFQQPGGPPPFRVRESGYAQIHVDLALAMYDLTGRNVYRAMADRWTGALPWQRPVWMVPALAAAFAGLLSCYFIVRQRRGLQAEAA